MPQGHLTRDERYVLTHLHQAGFSDAAIARRIGRHRATVGRELRRNANQFGDYHDEPAALAEFTTRKNRHSFDISPPRGQASLAMAHPPRYKR